MSTCFTLLVVLLISLSYVPTSCLEIKLGHIYSDEPQNISEIVIQAAMSKLRNLKIIDSVNMTTYYGAGCSYITGSGVAADLYFRKGVDVLLGPKCSEGMTSTGYLAAYWNIPVLGYKSTDTFLSDKRLYKTLVRTNAGQETATRAIHALLLHFGWHKVALVQLCAAETSLTKTFGCALITGALRTQFADGREDIAIVYDTMLINTTYEATVPVLNMIRSRARVENNMSNSRDFMINAQRMNMTTSDYVYIHVMGLRTAMIVLEPWQSAVGDGHDEEAKKAFEGVLLVQPVIGETPQYTAINDIVKSQTGKSIWDMPNSLIWVSNYPMIYDAVYAFGLALNASYTKTDGYNYSGEVIFRNSRCLDFEGITGRVRFDNNADRMPLYAIVTLDTHNHLSHFGILEPTLSCDSRLASYKFSQLRNNNWRTSEGNAPPDKPTCGFQNEMCRTPDYTIHILTSSCGAVGIFGILYFIWRKKRRDYEDALYGKRWCINPKLIRYAPEPNIGGSLGELGLATNFYPTTYGKVHTDSTGTMCFYGGQTVQSFVHKKIGPTALKRSDLRRLMEIKDLRHENLNVFIGANFETEQSAILFLWDSCRRGSLEDILFNPDVQLDAVFKASLMRDFVKGLEFLHRSPVGVHGTLFAKNCVIDSRWVLKLSNFGTASIYTRLISNKSVLVNEPAMKDLVQMAPEMLRAAWNLTPRLASQSIDENFTLPVSREADIFGAGMVMYQIICRRPPFDDDAPLMDSILIGIRQGDVKHLIRPNLAHIADAEAQFKDLRDVISCCWEEQSISRPSALTVKKAIYRFTSMCSSNIVDHAAHILERYASGLEKVVEERTKEVVAERERADRLLCQLLPSSIAADLKLGRPIAPESFDEATILFTDLVGFTKFCSVSSPLQVVTLLNTLYTHIDEILSTFEVYKMETIGDAYLIVSGLPHRNGDRHVMEIANLSLEILNFIMHVYHMPHKPTERVKMRFGMHSGPVVAGTVGTVMPRYCIFGDTVNMASRMESTGEAMKIQVSETSKNRLMKWPAYILQSRGKVDIKGKGPCQTYWLEGKDSKETT